MGSLMLDSRTTEDGVQGGVRPVSLAVKILVPEAAVGPVPVLAGEPGPHAQ